MIALVYMIACAAFCAAFLRLELLAHTRRLWAIFAEAGQIIGDRGLSDDEKEPLIRQAALRSLKGTAGLVMRLCAVLAVAALPVLAAMAAGLTGMSDIVAFSLNPVVLVLTVVCLAGLTTLWRRRGRA